MAKILLLNGPNLNLLGRREPERYGATDLATIEARLRENAEAAGAHIVALQSNSEAALIERIHQAMEEGVDSILFNPGAFTHSSIALRDALLAAQIPFIEIHVSNIHAREEFRRRSYFSDIAAGTISGFGALGYELALQGALAQMTNNKQGG